MPAAWASYRIAQFYSRSDCAQGRRLTSAAVVETPVAAINGASTLAGVVYIDSATGNRVILEVYVVTVGSNSSLPAPAQGRLSGVTSL